MLPHCHNFVKDLTRGRQLLLLLGDVKLPWPLELRPRGTDALRSLRKASTLPSQRATGYLRRKQREARWLGGELPTAFTP